MTAFILIFTVYSGVYYSAVSAMGVRFETEAACQTARAAVLKEFGSRTKALCVEAPRSEP